MKRLWVWIVSLIAFSFVGFAVAIVFHRSDAPILVLIIYGATATFLVAVALVILAISRWEGFKRSRRNVR